MVRCIAGVLILALFASPVRAELAGRVVRVSDGDTLTIVTAKKREVRVRLFGIDAPEKGQPYAEPAKRFLSDSVFGRHVRVVEQGKDRYGRVLGVVMVRAPWNEVVDVNGHLVEAGLAWTYVGFSRKYAPQEAAARKERHGVWKEPGAVAPWEWRGLRRLRERSGRGIRPALGSGDEGGPG